MGDYGLRVCTVCGNDVFWEEAFYMRDEIVCCSEKCYGVHRDREKRATKENDVNIIE
ncbi:MAG: hypothetical protein PHN75_08560 [Syntrophales bacterium]|nr:hypothetical protein [Syntrophales bacterium]